MNNLISKTLSILSCMRGTCVADGTHQTPSVVTRETLKRFFHHINKACLRTHGRCRCKVPVARMRQFASRQHLQGRCLLTVWRLTMYGSYRTANLQTLHFIYSTNIGTEYFKHALYSPFFSLQNAVCFTMLTCLVPVLFTFYIQNVLKLKKIIPAPKG